MPARQESILDVIGPIDRVDDTPVSVGDRIGGALAGAVRGFAEIPAGLLDAGAIAFDAIEDFIDPEEPADIRDLSAFQYAAAIREMARSLRQPGPEDDLFSTKVAEGLGSALGFLGSGGAGGLAAKLVGGAARKAVQTAAVAGVGAAVGGASAFREARAAGASEENQWRAFLANAVVGTTEVVPISRFLVRLDKRSGGGIRRVLIDALAEGTEELLQESFQQTVGNIIAKELYDEERDILEGVIESGGAGLFSGVLLSAAISAIPGRGSIAQAPTEDQQSFEEQARAIGIGTIDPDDGVPSDRTETSTTPIPQTLPKQGLLFEEEVGPDAADRMQTDPVSSEQPTTTQGAFVAKEETFLQSTHRKMVDRLSRPKAVLRQATEEGRPGKPDEVAQDLVLFNGAARNRIGEFNATTEADFIRHLGDNDITLEQVDELAEAIQALDVNRVMMERGQQVAFAEAERQGRIQEVARLERELSQAMDLQTSPITARDAVAVQKRIDALRRRINQDAAQRTNASEKQAAKREFDLEDNPGSGLPNSEAQAIIAAASSSPKRRALFEAVRRVQGVNRQRLENALKAGLVSQETFDLWRSLYPNYVPLRSHVLRSQGNFAGGRGIAVRGPESRKRKGRSSRADSPTAFSFTQFKQSILREEKAKVDQGLLAFVRANPSKDWIISEGRPKPTLNPETGEIETSTDPVHTLGELSLPVKENGKELVITFRDNSLARALKGANVVPLGPLLRILIGINRVYALTRTTLSLEFIFWSNPIRDTLAAAINIRAQDVLAQTQTPLLPSRPSVGTVTIKRKLKGASGKMVNPARFAGAARAVWRGVNRRAGESSEAKEWDRWYQRFAEAGVPMVWHQAHDSLEQEASLKAQMKALESDPRRAPFRAARSAFDAFVNLSNAAENATRLNAFRTGVEAGLTDKQSAVMARELTVNFEQKGEYGQVFNAFYVFANANVQGAAILVRNLTRSPSVRRIGYAAVLGGVILEQMNRLIAGEDDDGENFYDKVPDFVKDNNLVFADPVNQGMFYTIPSPWGFSALINIGRSISSFASGHATAGEASGLVLRSVVDAFNPLGTSDPILAFTPTVFRLPVELAINRDGLGRQIRPTDFGTSLEAESHKFTFAKEPYPAIVKAINELGGSKFRSGVLDIHPDDAEHFVEFLGGSTLKFLGNTFATIASGGQVELQKVPMLRRMVSESSPWHVNASFNDTIEDLNRMEAEIKDARASGDPTALRAIKSHDAGLWRVLHSSSWQASSSAVRRLRSLSRHATGEQKDRILKQIDEMQRRFNRMVNDTKDKAQ